MKSTAIQAKTVYEQDTAPNDKGALWLDTSKSPTVLKYYNGNEWDSAKPTQTPLEYDKAVTFGESDVTVTNNNTIVNSNNVELGTGRFANYSPSYDSTGNRSNKIGMKIVPQTDLKGMYGYENNGNLTTAYILDSNGNVLSSQSIGNVGNREVEITQNMTSGNTYYFVADAGGSSVNTTRYNNNTFTSDYYDVTNGYNAGEDSSWQYAWRDIEAIADAPNGNSIIEWSGVRSITEWKSVTFKRTLDNENVDVYLEYNNGNGWNKTNNGNPIPRGYDLTTDSNISQDTDLRIDVNISRSNTSNNPRLNNVYLNWTP